jgi:hypothetical protein
VVLLALYGLDHPARALIIENYVWRGIETDPLDELARARDFIRANLGRRD